MWKKALDLIRDGIRELFPAYFALVMATGIISIACHLLEMDVLAFPLFYLNQFFYAVLGLLMLGRLIRHFPRVLADLSNHSTGPGFFTLVAGTNVLGSQFVILKADTQAAFLLWLLGLLLWLILIYAFFAVMTLKEEKPPLEKGINGAWLVTVVSTQSLTVLGALIASRFGEGKEVFLFSVLCFYLLGCMLYLLIISLIFYRFMFYKVDPHDLTPPYWINMGALAITTVNVLNCRDDRVVDLRHSAAWGLRGSVRMTRVRVWAGARWLEPCIASVEHGVGDRYRDAHTTP